MNDLKVVFNSPAEILDFVNTVEKYPYAMDLKKGRIIVDAKSVLGIMSIGLKNQIELKVYEENCDDLRKEISKFVAA